MGMTEEGWIGRTMMVSKQMGPMVEREFEKQVTYVCMCDRKIEKKVTDKIK